MVGEVGGDEKDELRRNPNSKNDDVGHGCGGLAVALVTQTGGDRNPTSSGADTRRLDAKPVAVATRSGPADPGDNNSSAGRTAVVPAAAGLDNAAIDRANVIGACPYGTASGTCCRRTAIGAGGGKNVATATSSDGDGKW